MKNKFLLGILVALAIPLGVPLLIIVLAVVLGLTVGAIGLALSLTAGIIVLIIGVLSLIFGLWIAAIAAAFSIWVTMIVVALTAPILALVLFFQGSVSLAAVLFGLGLLLVLIPLAAEFCRFTVRLFKGSVNFSAAHIHFARSSKHAHKRRSDHSRSSDTVQEAKVKKARSK
jgi:uncharacterized membrane protein